MPSFIEQLIHNFTNSDTFMVGTSGAVERDFYYRNSSKNRKSKSNQRKGRKLSRRRKMMARAK